MYEGSGCSTVSSTIDMVCLIVVILTSVWLLAPGTIPSPVYQALLPLSLTFFLLASGGFLIHMCYIVLS